MGFENLSRDRAILWHCLTAQCEPTTCSFAVVFLLLRFGWLPGPLKSLLLSFHVSLECLLYGVHKPAWFTLLRLSQPQLRAPTKREDLITTSRVRADAPAHLLIPRTKFQSPSIELSYMVLRAGREPFIDHFEVVLSSKKEATG